MPIFAKLHALRGTFFLTLRQGIRHRSGTCRRPNQLSHGLRKNRTLRFLERKHQPWLRQGRIRRNRLSDTRTHSNLSKHRYCGNQCKNNEILLSQIRAFANKKRCQERRSWETHVTRCLDSTPDTSWRRPHSVNLKASFRSTLSLPWTYPGQRPSLER